MSRAWLICDGLLLGLVAEVILWNGPLWYSHQEGKLSPTFTRVVGVAVLVQGAVAALGAALCFGLALIPSRLSADAGSSPSAVRGGLVLVFCGLVFLLAAGGCYQRAAREARGIEEVEEQEERMPGHWPAETVEGFRRELRLTQTFAVLWVVVGGALLVAPLLLTGAVTRVSGRLNWASCRLAVGGLLLSGLGSLVWLGAALIGAVGAIGGGRAGGGGNGLSLVGLVGILAGAVVAVCGCILAGLGRQEG